MNNEHTPTTQKMSRVRDLYGIATAYDANDNASKHIKQIRAKNYAEFDEMIAEVIAAAEQRGAIKALRDAAGAIEKNNIVFDGDHYQPCNSCMSIHMNWLDYRADRIADQEPQDRAPAAPIPATDIIPHQDQ